MNRLELQKSENTLKLSAFICVYLSDICGFWSDRRLMQSCLIQKVFFYSAVPLPSIVQLARDD
jgi:hypothetical protein